MNKATEMAKHLATFCCSYNGITTRYLVRAGVRPGGETSLLQAIQQRTLGKVR